MNKDGQFEFRIDRIRTPHSKPEMIESLKRFAAVRGSQSLEMRDYDAWEERLLHSETISRHLGGWGKALQAAGLRATDPDCEAVNLTTAMGHGLRFGGAEADCGSRNGLLTWYRAIRARKASAEAGAFCCATSSKALPSAATAS